MKPRPKILIAVLPFLACLALAPRADAIDVLILEPRTTEAVFGEVEVVVDVLSANPLTEVILRLDGKVVGRLTQPPWRLTVDVGQRSEAHVFEVSAHDDLGGSATASRTTRKIDVDEEVDLELQQLFVTVTRGGRRVLDLEETAFEVLDDGASQKIVTFEGGDVPMTAVLMVDTSTSMRGARMKAALAGARAFVQGMKELDEAMLMLFSDRLLHRSNFSGDAAVVGARLDRIEADGGTAVNDHLYSALKILEARQGRRVVILLSDGVDIESVLDMKDVIWKAQRSQALIYWIRPRDPNEGSVVSRFSAWRDMDEHERELAGLAQAVEQSGGRIREIERIDDATQAFREILTELREQYVIGYYPTNSRNDEAWHKVKVRVQGSGLRLRAREGYIDF